VKASWKKRFGVWGMGRLLCQRRQQKRLAAKGKEAGAAASRHGAAQGGWRAAISLLYQ